jgi:hypothetical protein
LPLAETIYLVPEYRVELFWKEESINIDKIFRKDTLGLGLGVPSRLGVWIQFEYLNRGLINFKRSDIGDFFVKSKYHIGDYFFDTLHVGYCFNIRFPLGKDAYSSGAWRNLAFGKNEIKTGLYSQIDIYNAFFVHLNLMYNFREGNAEDFWGGFYLDITKNETWEKAFGLNPYAEKTFLAARRLRNDYMGICSALSTSALYPFVPFVESYLSFRLYQKGNDTASLPIEAGKVNPVIFLSAGLRYFIKYGIYLGVYTIQNPRRESHFTGSVYGLELSLQL